MDETNEKLDQCIEAMQDNAQKMNQVLEDRDKLKKDNDSKDKIIKWLIIAIITFIVTAGIVCAIAVYGYMYSPFMAGEITQSGAENAGNQVQVIGG
jgi:hypothetical protein